MAIVGPGHRHMATIGQGHRHMALIEKGLMHMVTIEKERRRMATIGRRCRHMAHLWHLFFIAQMTVFNFFISATVVLPTLLKQNLTNYLFQPSFVNADFVSVYIEPTT